MRIAVTTASGQLGRAVINQLTKDVGTEEVIGIARTPAKAADLGVEIRKGDYNSREDFETALQGVDRLLIISNTGDPAKRPEQHRNIIEAAQSSGVSKLVYTSIIGKEEGNDFGPVVISNRETERDIQSSGLDYVIGRNCIYIEPDLEYIDQYLEAGEVSNCAGDGRCGYTSRSELALAYSNMLRDDQLNGQIYNLAGPPITQAELVELINEVYGTTLHYRPVSVDEYLAERKEAIGEFLGTIIAGIYAGMRHGAVDTSSDFEAVTGRPHLSPLEMIRQYKADS